MQRGFLLLTRKKYDELQSAMKEQRRASVHVQSSTSWPVVEEAPA